MQNAESTRDDAGWRVKFGPEMLRAIDRIGRATGLSREEVVQNALTTYDYLLTDHMAGNRFGVERRVSLINLPLICQVYGRQMKEIAFHFGKLTTKLPGDDS